MLRKEDYDAGRLSPLDAEAFICGFPEQPNGPRPAYARAPRSEAAPLPETKPEVTPIPATRSNNYPRSSYSWTRRAELVVRENEDSYGRSFRGPRQPRRR